MLLQLVATLLLLKRLARGFRRLPPVEPSLLEREDTTVSVILPTLNEADRVSACLLGLQRQGKPLTEVVVVDSGSTDDTTGVVRQAAAADNRIRLVQDPPLPAGWIGKVWALQHGLGQVSGEWVLGVDADTEANAGMVAGAVSAAESHHLDLVSFSPRFAGQSALERWLQPSLLVTLVYRHGPPRSDPPVDELLANGQCFLVRRSVLLAHGGYAPARESFADDVTLARYYARLGVRCGFLDGTWLFRVRAYQNAREMWREWGRSVDLGDTVGPARRWTDFAFLLLVQGLPLPVLGGGILAGRGGASGLALLNLGLVGIRVLMLAALAGSYERRGVSYWLSWLSDPLAVVRIFLSLIRRPREWRGRRYIQREAGSGKREAGRGKREGGSGGEPE